MLQHSISNVNRNKIISISSILNQKIRASDFLGSSLTHRGQIIRHRKLHLDKIKQEISELLYAQYQNDQKTMRRNECQSMLEVSSKKAGRYSPDPLKTKNFQSSNLTKKQQPFPQINAMDNRRIIFTRKLYNEKQASKNEQSSYELPKVRSIENKKGNKDEKNSQQQYICPWKNDDKGEQMILIK